MSPLPDDREKNEKTLEDYVNKKYDEIANRLDIPKGTVMSSLARARIKVAKTIKLGIYFILKFSFQP